MCGDSDGLREHYLVVGVGHFQVERFVIGQGKVVAFFAADDGLDVDGVSGAVDGAIGVDEGSQVALLVRSEFVRPRRDQGNVGPVSGQYPRIVRLRASLDTRAVEGKRGHAVRAGFCIGLTATTDPENGLSVLDGSAGFTVGDI